MSKKLYNATNIEGLLYEHKLELKTTGENSKNPGTEFISGTIDIATNDALDNIVPVHFTYVTAKTSKGATNTTYNILMNIIDGNYGSIMTVGKEQAVKLKISSAIGLNEFYSDRNGTEELISAKRNEGGFVHVVTELTDDEKQRNTFKCDMLITNVTLKEANEERQIPEKAIVKGAIFDFRGALLPVEFSAVNQSAIDYFLSLEASDKNPIFTCLWGKQISDTVVRTITNESAFGEAEVREVKNTRKDFVITGANPETYEWDTEETLTAKELREKIADRETYLATMKQRSDEYKASRTNGIANTIVNNGGFDF